MLFGGRASYATLQPRDLAGFMRRKMLRVFPQLAGARIDYAWGGKLGITLNRMPHLGRIDGETYFAHGFSGHGVALSGLAGKLMAEAVAGTAERFDVFARIPHRPFPGGRARTPLLVLAMLYYRLRDLL
jgi:gamma-glutamylputrescine oxidase